MIEGESGIGKTRLLDEVRTLARVEGASGRPGGQADSDARDAFALLARAPAPPPARHRDRRRRGRHAGGAGAGRRGAASAGPWCRFPRIRRPSAPRCSASSARSSSGTRACARAGHRRLVRGADDPSVTANRRLPRRRLRSRCAPAPRVPPRREASGGENARSRGLARRWASPCSNSPRAARTRPVRLDGVRRFASSDVGALRNCARRGPRRPRPRVTRALPTPDGSLNRSDPLRQGTSLSGALHRGCKALFPLAIRSGLWQLGLA